MRPDADIGDRDRFWRAFGACSLALLVAMGSVAVFTAPERASDQYSAAAAVSRIMEESGGGSACKMAYEDGGDPDGMVVFYRDPDGSYAELSIDPDGLCSRASYGFFSASGRDVAANGQAFDVAASCAAFDRLSALASSAGGAASAAGEGFEWVTPKRARRAQVSGPYAHTRSEAVETPDGRRWYVSVAVSNAGDSALVEATVAPVPGF